MSPVSPLEAIVFDAYGTLFDLSAAGRACTALFGERGAAVYDLWRAKQLEYAYLLTLMGRYENFLNVTGRALDFAVRATGVSIAMAGRERLLDTYRHPTLYPETRRVLDALAPRPRLVLSNGTPAMLEAALEELGLSDVFGAVLSADAVRVYKPSPAVYELARALVGGPAGAIGFVSSNGFDVSGAKAFGFYTFWVNRSGGTPETLDLPADSVISDLTGLLDHPGRA